MAIIKLIIATILSLSQIITPFVQFAVKGGIDNFFEEWSIEDEYTADYAIELEKDPDKDFVILNFTDIQLTAADAFGKKGDNSKKVIKQSIEKAQPDLITLTGDNASSWVGYIDLAEYIDSFGIPWAPVMGNHDGTNGSRIHEAWISYVLTTYDNCLYKFGPKGMGFGNYIINITENEKVIHTLFMMDTHSQADNTKEGIINYGVNEDGSKAIGYDHFWQNQLDWYKWAVKGIAKLEGKTVKSSVFMHIPVVEYIDAANLMCEQITNPDGSTCIVAKEQYKDTSLGSLGEGICPPQGNNGFFDLALNLGSTKNMIFGHDHLNDLSLVYKGIRLSYGLKSGYGSYWDESKIGASVLAVDSNGETDFYHIPYNAE